MVDTGANPVAVTISRDGVNGSTGVSKAFGLGSNPSLCVLLRDLTNKAYTHLVKWFVQRIIGRFDSCNLRLTWGFSKEAF